MYLNIFWFEKKKASSRRVNARFSFERLDDHRNAAIPNLIAKLYQILFAIGYIAQN